MRSVWGGNAWVVRPLSIQYRKNTNYRYRIFAMSGRGGHRTGHRSLDQQAKSDALLSSGTPLGECWWDSSVRSKQLGMRTHSQNSKIAAGRGRRGRCRGVGQIAWRLCAGLSGDQTCFRSCDTFWTGWRRARSALCGSSWNGCLGISHFQSIRYGASQRHIPNPPVKFWPPA